MERYQDMTNSQKIFIELAYGEYHRQQQGDSENYGTDKYAKARKMAREKVKK